MGSTLLLQIIASLLQIIFYSPLVSWMPSSLPQGAVLYLLDLNPTYLLLELVRGPLLGILPGRS
jgi:lipopolysaccharide transport system permease protein